MKRFYVFFCICLAAVCSHGQVNFTANDTVYPYQETFGYGTNAGWFPPHSNFVTANLAAGNPSVGVTGAGCRSIRAALPDNHLTTWGVNVDLGSWQHYDQIGLKENVAFIGYPHSSNRETAIYCPARNAQSGMFRGMHLPIWDGGANGTPVNENNTYALYLWNTVSVYKPYVRFWEVWNEPDFDNGQNGWRGPSDANSWWNRDDFGCELVRFNGTIYDYIRLLRVTWEVVKYLDPDAYVTTGGIGYESFLDAILRNTDNPVDGSVTATHPLKGGAYFDCLSYHVYPQFEPEVRRYDLGIGGWVNNRHSDGSANGVIGKKDRFDQVLHDRGYDGNTYPEKRWILTEHNVGRRSYGTSVGGEDIQRNYQIKSLVLQQLAGIDQAYVYGLAETDPLSNAVSTFDLMGLYTAISNVSAYNQPLTSSGVANLTMEELLHGSRIDRARTQALNLPSGVRGGAFRFANGNYVYILWAETQTDFSEVASASYSFPANLNLSHLTRYEWDHAQTGLSTQVLPTNLALTGTPIFLEGSATLPVELQDFTAVLNAEQSVDISWTTASEKDNAFFTVERSTDGQLFESLQNMPSQGDSQRPQLYEVEDPQPLPGKSYYRLKQTDIDGKSSYSRAVEIFFEPRLSLNLEVVPNPLALGQELAVSFELKQDAPFALEVRDIQGRLVWEKRTKGSAGINRLSIFLPTLTKGLYHFHFRSGDQQQAEKLLIQ
jgi:hypothetical protein